LKGILYVLNSADGVATTGIPWLEYLPCTYGCGVAQCLSRTHPVACC